MSIERDHIEIRVLKTASERNAAIPALAALRREIFREWPYLYEGSMAYEQAYLTEFITEAHSALVVARDQGEVVGASTASPMKGQKAAFKQPFIDRGIDIDRLFYFGESVLMPEYRGLGIGHAFFDAREAAARDFGADASCFCAVVRPDDHPKRPEIERDLKPFWQHRGYEKVDGLICQFDWTDIGEPQETSHPMQFWMRRL